MISAQRIEELVSLADGTSLAEEMAQLPDHPIKSSAISLAMSGTEDLMIAAIDTLAMAYGQGAYRDEGIECAIAAAHIHMRRSANTSESLSGSEITEAMAAARNCNIAVDALEALARYDQAIDLADSMIPWFEQAGEVENLPNIKIIRAEALMRLGRTREAETALASFRGQDLPATQKILFDRVSGELGVILNSQTRLADPPSVPSSVTEHQETLSLLTRGTEALRSGATGMDRWQAQELLRQATAIFVDSRQGRDPVLIARSEETLRSVREWLHDNKLRDDENDALWGLYLCRSRLGDNLGAAEFIETLLDQLDAQRKSIRNPADRAAVHSKYPHAIPVLCGLYFQMKRPDSLLATMERGKGRALADYLLLRQGNSEEPGVTDGRQTINELRAAAETEDFHYLSLFTDEDVVYAVLVTRDGELHAQQVRISEQLLRNWQAAIDPAVWGAPDPTAGLFGGERLPDLSEALAPLISWMEPLCTDGAIQAGEHIVYSPDGYLHNMPLHFVQFANSWLGEKQSVSRTHSAEQIVRTLARPSDHPSGQTIVQVSAHGDGRDLTEGLSLVPRWLAESSVGGPSVLLKGEEATVAAISEQDLRGRLVHFASHGTFPVEGGTTYARNPYESAGVVLAGPGGLPDRSEIAAGEGSEFLLSPKAIDQLGIDLSGSHVTLQACVTGRSSEGTGGDALGLEWAFLRHGAGSVLSSHWNIPARQSGEFCKAFYQAWLKEGLSRSHAWSAATKFMAKSGALRDWAAFSLSGDWR